MLVTETNIYLPDRKHFSCSLSSRKKNHKLLYQSLLLVHDEISPVLPWHAGEEGVRKRECPGWPSVWARDCLSSMLLLWDPWFWHVVSTILINDYELLPVQTDEFNINQYIIESATLLPHSPQDLECHCFMGQGCYWLPHPQAVFPCWWIVGPDVSWPIDTCIKNYPWHTPEISQVACITLCCPSCRCQGDVKSLSRPRVCHLELFKGGFCYQHCASLFWHWQRGRLSESKLGLLICM